MTALCSHLSRQVTASAPPAASPEIEDPEPPEPVRGAPEADDDGFVPIASRTRRPKAVPHGRVSYRLKARDGLYLHESTGFMTPSVKFAWRGTEQQLTKLIAKKPDLANLVRVQVIAHPGISEIERVLAPA